jgi:hypothetical protein
MHYSRQRKENRAVTEALAEPAEVMRQKSEMPLKADILNPKR